MRCTQHGRTNCLDRDCARKRREARESSAAIDDLTNPISPLHQAVYGDTAYGSGSSDSGSSSSYDSGSSSCSGGE